MKASFSSPCAEGCGSPIQIDDEITLTSDLEWAHAECPLAGDPLAVDAPLCSRCFLYHRGECP